MYDYLRRFLIVFAVALCIGLLFISATVSFAESNEKYETVNFIWPTVGMVSDTFGTRNGKHYGIDIAAPRGTEVVSVSDGVVTKSYYSNTYGNVVFIEHTDDFETVYGHLHKRIVEEGDIVYQGEQIGTVGDTGRSSGDHLHFEVHNGNWTMAKNNAIDPFLLLGENQNTFFVLSDEVKENKQYKVASASTKPELEFHEGNGSQYTVVKVKKGETLWSIADKYQVSVDDIKILNGLKSDNILINQNIKIVSNGNYIVQKGDNLWKIAEQSGVSIKELKKINDLQGDTIKVGELLKVRKE